MLILSVTNLGNFAGMQISANAISVFGSKGKEKLISLYDNVRDAELFKSMSTACHA